ncbi:4-hydroxy-2-oxovalerate aldolase [Colletotrichum tofieldiae]|nr:4-hydroxy-2-oxovalerate aldolase [Colletotrichum tofieldiae]
MTQYTTQLSYAAIAEVVNDEVLIMPMIETKEGVENVELGIPGQYDSDLFHSTVSKIAAAAEKASIDGRKVFVGLGGLEPRPDLLEELAKRHAPIRLQ